MFTGDKEANFSGDSSVTPRCWAFRLDQTVVLRPVLQHCNILGSSWGLEILLFPENLRHSQGTGEVCLRPCMGRAPERLVSRVPADAADGVQSSIGTSLRC
jgi:hypothetical protein